MLQIDEQYKTSEKELNETEIKNILGKTFKVMIIKDVHWAGEKVEVLRTSKKI